MIFAVDIASVYRAVPSDGMTELDKSYNKSRLKKMSESRVVGRKSKLLAGDYWIDPLVTGLA